MVKADEIQAIIDVLPNIFINFVPGYIYIQVHRYVFNIKGGEIKNNIFEYIMLSFIINSIAIFLLNIFNYFCKTNFSMIMKSVQLIIYILTITLSYLVSILLKSEYWSKKMIQLGINRNNSSNVFRELIDYEKGTWVKIYMNKEKIVYDGALIKFDFKGKYEESFIILENYETYEYGDSGLHKKMFIDKGSINSHVAIKVSEISRLEVTYESTSKKISKKSVS
ncbi:hypothetical protein J1C67_15170 [Clostridium gasigenes]|uniref:hypothetical protein n=1 Tax=Clostridium gasigenes TaxID=94869 RepID=UPI00143868D0|nr:hypothetical protein [Clostridium gasigenes]NKF05422.1 hypothetical protein [Clostridium gasigenes]QSW18868.1 hypothetical protein J1C67_15170 [Clostridium gasigenes]